MFLLVLPALLVLGGCSGGGGGGGGGGTGTGTAAYDWDFNIRLTNSAGEALADFANAHLIISTDSGSVSDPTYQGTTLSFRITGIEIEPNIVTVTVLIPGRLPIGRQYRLTLNSLIDESGDNFDTWICLCSMQVNGSGVRYSDPVPVNPVNGTSAEIVLATPADAGNGVTGTATLPQGTLLTKADGTNVTGTATMMLSVHDANQAESRHFFRCGTYNGIVVDPTGYPGFTPTGHDFYTANAFAAFFSCLTLRDQDNNRVTMLNQSPTATFTLPNGQLGPDGNPLVAGDQIPFFIYDDANGLWIFLTMVTITEGPGGVLQVEGTFQFNASGAAQGTKADPEVCHAGGFFFLNNIQGEHQVPPEITGGD